MVLNLLIGLYSFLAAEIDQVVQLIRIANAGPLGQSQAAVM